MSLSTTLEELKHTGAGDHMVMLYDNDDYNAEISAAYIGSRMIKNEKCFYISGDADHELLLKKLGLFIDVEESVKSGQLSILSKSDAYSKEGHFNPDSMIQMLKELSLEAIEQGYVAFAITGEISWVLDYESGFEKIMDYEYKLNKEIFGKYPVSAICRYNLTKFSSEMIKSIIEVHPIIIWEGQIHDNPFYFDVIDIESVDIAEYHVKAMLNAITSFTNTKSKFYQEIQEKEHQNQKLQLNFMKNIIISLSSLLEIHDMYTKNHSENVAKVARKIAKAMGLPEEEVAKIYYAGLVHDIGKTVIPSEIINKIEKLTDEEFAIIKKHSSYGYEALIKTEELKDIADVVLQHHERYDGKGYPLHHKGDEIPLGARILCVADAYDAMVNDRPYHGALTKNEAINELLRCAGTQFDREIVEIFISLVLVLEKIDDSRQPASTT